MPKEQSIYSIVKSLRDEPLDPNLKQGKITLTQPGDLHRTGADA